MIRSTDPVKAAQLDAAANELRAGIDEPEADAVTTARQSVIIEAS